MQINPLPGVRFTDTFYWNSPRLTEALKTIKRFDAIFGGLAKANMDHISTRLYWQNNKRIYN